MSGNELQIQIPEKVKDILQRLEENRFEAYVVGGCVRDSILGREPGDWDITTSAVPEQVKRIFRRTVDTGIAHGTVTVLIGDEEFEVTTYRVDGKYEDHRHPSEVLFTPSLEEDLKRRDFTINAMAYNPKEGLVDLFGGVEDLRKKCVRCVGDPVCRFSEDALRMLRGIRFAAQLGFQIEESTKAAIGELADTIQRVSAERIRVEITKLLLSNDPWTWLEAEETGLASRILPEFGDMLATGQNNPHHCYDVGRHCLRAVEEVDRLCADRDEWTEKTRTALVYAALLHDVGKPGCKTTDEKGLDHFYGHDRAGSEMAKGILRRLKFDNDTISRVVRLVRFHEHRYRGSRKAMRRLISKAGADIMPGLFVLQEADVRAQSEYEREEKLSWIRRAKEEFDSIMENQEAVCLKDLSISGRDLIGMGMKPGPGVGEVLNQLLEIVMDDPSKNNGKELLKEAQKYITIIKGNGER